MLFDSWDSLWRIVVIGTMAYVGLVFLLRISGNRTLSKLNSFDLVVTIAFGSTLASALLDRKVSLAQGLTAMALLVLLQFVITWLSVRSKLVSRVVKTEPTLLLKDGQLRRSAMENMRVTEDEIRAALRQQGLGELQQAAAVTLETDGSLSVISVRHAGSLDVLQGVRVGDTG